MSWEKESYYTGLLHPVRIPLLKGLMSYKIVLTNPLLPRTVPLERQDYWLYAWDKN